MMSIGQDYKKRIVKYYVHRNIKFDKCMYELYDVASFANNRYRFIGQHKISCCILNIISIIHLK